MREHEQRVLPRFLRRLPCRRLSSSPRRLHPARPFLPSDMSDLASWIVVPAFDVAISYCGGAWSLKPLAFLLLGTYMGVGLHPIAGHVVSEHVMMANDGQETHSCYDALLNPLLYNFGYHVEHHDFPNIPWNRRAFEGWLGGEGAALPAPACSCLLPLPALSCLPALSACSALLCRMRSSARLPSRPPSPLSFPQAARPAQDCARVLRPPHQL